jgi:hypothetical protein
MNPAMKIIRRMELIHDFGILIRLHEIDRKG